MTTGRAAEAPARHDAIVVGSGVAGLRAAIEAAEAGLRVALLAKDSASDSNTDQAQGGVAVALSDEDEVGLHYRDTLAAGDGLCDEEAVRVMVGEGPRDIARLIEWGARFDREGPRLAFTREAAHSARRVLHAQGDSTGREILRALWGRAESLDRILFLPHTYTVDLLLEADRCRGLLILDEEAAAVVRLEAPAVVLATGGLGRIFLETTNPPQATGDGVAIAWRAGALLRDMEFVQFHPTALHVEGAPRFLLSEALRGEGGLLRSADGRLFMAEVDPRAELAPRDVVARAIASEMRRSGADHVLLDMTHLDPDYVRRRFPRIHATCLGHGVDIARRPVPVVPAAHYAMGGIATDLWGRSSLAGLYAAGEVACTGVHGANRLASNSLLEGLVFGARVGRALVEDRPVTPGAGGEAAPPGGMPRSDAARAAATVEAVRRISWERLGLVRAAAGLAGAVDELDMAEASLLEAAAEAAEGRPDRGALEALNAARTASLVARSAIVRAESRGAHYRVDFPRRDDERFGRSSYIRSGMERAALAAPAAARVR